MKLLRILAISIGTLLVLSNYHGRTRADDWTKMTKITFGEQVQVPGTVLQPGTYTFKLADSQSNRHIVQIFNEDNTSLITTVMAIPNYRLEPTGKTVLEFGERPVDQPVTLEAWFYPGDNFGQEFVYPESEAKQLSQLNHTEVPSTGSEEAYPGNKTEPQPAPEAKETPTPQPRTEEPSRTPPSPPPTAGQQSPTYPSESNAAPNPTPNHEPSTNPQPAPRQESPKPEAKTLPQTASLLPLVGLIGFAFLGIALLLRLALKS
jgi:hypothetical protein